MQLIFVMEGRRTKICNVMLYMHTCTHMSCLQDHYKNHVSCGIVMYLMKPKANGCCFMPLMLCFLLVCTCNRRFNNMGLTLTCL